MRFLSKLLFFVLIFSVLAESCGRSRRHNNDDDDTSVRMGEELQIENLKNYDAQPDISADGQKLSFLSGRDEELRIYLFDRQGTAKPTRLTDNDKDLSFESEAALSPDGKWVIIVGTGEKGVNLYARDFAKSSALVQLTDDVSIESHVVISSDSKLFAFSVREPGSNGAQIYVGKIDASTGPVASSLKAVNTDVTDESMPAWVKADGSNSYTLLSLQRSAPAYNHQIVKRTITLGASLSSSESTGVAAASDLDLNRSVPYVATDTKVIFVADNFDQSIKGIKPVGSATFVNTISVQARVASVSLAGGSRTFLDSAGISESSVSIAASGVGAWISLIPTACGKDNEATYKTAINLYTPADTTKVSTLFVTVKTDGKNEPTEAVCLSADEVAAKTVLDGSMLFAKINANATAQDFVIAYVSLATNDNEVLVFERKAGVDSVIKVSNNPS